MSETARPLTPVLVSLIAALALQLIPLPAGVGGMRPDWVMLVLLYWCLAQPDRIGLAAAFVLGLLLDTMSGALLGQHALALLLVCYLALKFRLRIRIFPMVQMTLVVLALLLLYQFTLFWIDGVSNRGVALDERLLPLLPGALAWPLLFWLLSRTQRRESDEATAL